MRWSSKSFCRDEFNINLVMHQLTNFLNEKSIEKFIVVQMDEDYIEIVYQK